MKLKYETSAGGIVYKKIDGKTMWLVIKPSKGDWWGFPKGRVGDKVRNETNEAAALREVKEESGVDVEMISTTPTKIQYMYKLQGYLIKKTVYYYLMEYKSGNIEDHDFEVGEVKWLPKKKVLDIITYKSDKEAFKKLST